MFYKIIIFCIQNIHQSFYQFNSIQNPQNSIIKFLNNFWQLNEDPNLEPKVTHNSQSFLASDSWISSLASYYDTRRVDERNFYVLNNNKIVENERKKFVSCSDSFYMLFSPSYVLPVPAFSLKQYALGSALIGYTWIFIK